MNRFIGQGRVQFSKVKQFFLRQSNVRKILIVGFLFIGLPAVGVLLLFLTVWSGVLGELPDKETLRLVQNPVSAEIYSADSVLLGKYFIQERSDIRYEDIPQHVMQAVVATEDIRFHEHDGIDLRSFLRVLVKSILLQNESSGGGSTITQQLAKNLYPRKDYYLLSLPVNKTREMIIASRLEDVYDKKTLLTLYLNTIPFGDNTYGLEASSRRFFNVPAKKLTVDQGAVLIGMLKATYTYNPRIFPERATRRRNVVLAQMKKYAMLSPGQYDTLQALPLRLSYTKITHHEGPAPYFRDYIREELEAWCRAHTKTNGDPYDLYTDGLRIYTTIDSRLQAYAEEAVRRQMTVIQKKFNDHWGKRRPWDKEPGIVQDAIRHSDRYKNLVKQRLSKEAISKIMETPVVMNVFTWEGEEEVRMSPVDSIKHYLTFLNTGVLAMDPRQGAVKAWVGGINHHFFQYDHIRESTKRQVGSTFKPIVYAAALEQGVHPCDFISAEKTVYTDMDEWTPANAGEENYDLKYSMAGALAYSVNTVSVKVLEKAGIQNTLTLARKMGVRSAMPAVPSLALGVADLSMTEMVTAYACFANQGKAVTPFYMTAITTPDGQVLETFTPAPAEQALSPESAQLMLHMLRRTINEGTGVRLRTQYGITADIAGKTGTTQSNADGWFMAILPELVIGAWVGADDPRIHFRSTALGQGASTALPIVGNLLQQVQTDQEINSMMRHQFPELPFSLRNKLSCAMYKSDKNLFQRIFGKGKKEKENRRAFGEGEKEKKKKKKNFLEKLFGKE
jgi:penicillin-binding protein 1A